jgi:hypothetical protein
MASGCSVCEALNRELCAGSENDKDFPREAGGDGYVAALGDCACACRSEEGVADVEEPARVWGDQRVSIPRQRYFRGGRAKASLCS